MRSGAGLAAALMDRGSAVDWDDSEDEQVVWDDADTSRQWAAVVGRLPPPRQTSCTQSTSSQRSAATRPQQSQDDFLRFFPEYGGQQPQRSEAGRRRIARDDEPTPPRAKRRRRQGGGQQQKQQQPPPPPPRVYVADDDSISSDDAADRLRSGHSLLGPRARRSLAEEIEEAPPLSRAQPEPIEDFSQSTPCRPPESVRSSVLRRMREEEAMLDGAAAAALERNPSARRLTLSRGASATPVRGTPHPPPQWLSEVLDGKPAGHSPVHPSAVAAAHRCFRVEHATVSARSAPAGGLTLLLAKVCRDVTKKHAMWAQRPRDKPLAVRLRHVALEYGVAVAKCSVQSGTLPDGAAPPELTVLFTSHQHQAMCLAPGVIVEISEPYSVLRCGCEVVVVGADVAALPVAAVPDAEDPDAVLALLDQDAGPRQSARRRDDDWPVVLNDEWQLDPSLWKMIDAVPGASPAADRSP